MHTFWDAIAKGFQNYFLFSGSASRPEFWYFTLFFFPAYAIVELVDHLMFTPVVNLRELAFGEYLPLGTVDPDSQSVRCIRATPFVVDGAYRPQCAHSSGLI